MNLWWWDLLGWTDNPWRTVEDTPERQIERHDSGFTFYGRRSRADDEVCDERTMDPGGEWMRCIVLISVHAELPHAGPEVGTPVRSVITAATWERTQSAGGGR